MGRFRRAGLWAVTLLGCALLLFGGGVGGQTAATANLIVNGGFESGASAWAGNFSLVTDADLVHSGARAARVSNASARQAVAVQGGARYELTAWAIKNAPYVSYVRLKVEWRNAGGSLLRTNVSDLNSDDPNYRRISLGPVTAPSDAVRAIVYVQSVGTGDSYFDDISMVMTAPPPATATATLTPTHFATATFTLVPSATPSSTPSASPTATPTLLPAGMLTLNEILFHPAPNAGPGTLEARREWVELYNAGAVPISLEGYTLEDGEDMDPLPAVALPSGGFLILAGDENAFLADYPLFAGDVRGMADGALGNGLSNAGDALILRDGIGRVVDAMSYGEDVSIFETPCPTVPAGHSLEREPAGRDTDGAGDFVERETPSPGGTPLPTSTPTHTPTSTSTATPTLTATPASSPNVTPTPSATPAATTSTPTPPMWGVRLPLLLR